MATRNVLKIKTVNSSKSWKEKWLWLVFNDDATMKCSICGKFEERLSSMPGYSNSFIKGSQNYKTSALSDHESCQTHMQAIKFNLHEEATKKGEVYRPPPVKVTLPTNAPIAQGLKKKRYGNERFSKVIWCRKNEKKQVTRQASDGSLDNEIKKTTFLIYKRTFIENMEMYLNIIVAGTYF